jgi:eukaryotic-like serine/threonine-protein kinase
MDPVNDSPRVLGNRYEVGELLGRGGMAEVHAGRDARLGRNVAIKLLRTDLARDPTFQARFQREAQSAAALNHPAIVSVYDTGEESIVEAGGAVVNLPYIVMEHIAGRTLRDLLAEHHHLAADFALEITAGVLSALEYSHRIGIVHRDIKPANVMLTPTGDVKVMDFGIARAMADASSTMTQTQAVIGTAQYLSPEQARGEQVDTRSDLYSAGCLLFELLTGRPPFTADSPVAVAYQHVREPAPPPSQFVPGIPEAVDRVVLHSLAKDREDRYQTAAQFRADVEAARSGRPVMATAPTADSVAGATTQYVPAPDAGTRAMPPMTATGMAGQGGLLGQTNAGGYPPAYEDQGEYRPRDRSAPRSRRGPIIAGIAAVVVAALLGFLLFRVFNPGSATPTTTSGTIPTVKNLAQATAVDALSTAGFDTVNVETTPSASIPEGQVIDVDPAEGSTVPTTTAVILTVSGGPESVTIPESLVGLSVDEARAALSRLKLTIGTTSDATSFDPSIDPGLVTATDPPAGETAKPGDTVNLLISPATVDVPRLIGSTLERARQRLRNVDLRSAVTTVPNPGGVAEGTVVGQTPQAGFGSERKQTVQLQVAGPAQATSSPTTAPPTTTTPSPDPTTTTPDPTGTTATPAG